MNLKSMRWAGDLQRFGAEQFYFACRQPFGPELIFQPRE